MAAKRLHIIGERRCKAAPSSSPPVSYGEYRLDSAHLPPPPRLHSSDWNLLISGQLATHERTSLITTIFLECDEIEVARRLSAMHYDHGKAQAFVDVIHEGSFHTLYVRRRTG